MTDNEIIKTYKDKVNLIGSMTSVYLDEEDGFDLYTVMLNVLDLINRKESNIEGLTNAVKYLNEQLSSAKAEAVKEFAERLKEKFACLEYVVQTNRKTLPIERVKAEVDDVLQNGCSNVVDKILKETVGADGD